MKKTTKFISICAGTLLLGGIIFGFSKSDDRNFQMVKSLDVFNSVLKELEMFYVDTINTKEVVEYGMNKDCGLIVNSSRQILYASQGEDFAQAARTEALKVQNEMQAHLKLIF